MVASKSAFFKVRQIIIEHKERFCRDYINLMAGTARFVPTSDVGMPVRTPQRGVPTLERNAAFAAA